MATRTQPVPAATPSAPAPAEQLLQLSLGYMPAQCLWIAAKLGIADLVAKGPKPVAERAGATRVNEDALYRVLRALASIGVFNETSPRSFALTPLAEPLRSGKESIRDVVL